MGSAKKNFLYNAAYQILNILIPLITTPYLTRIIGADGIGEYSYAYSIAHYFVLFTLLGLNNYGNREIAKIRDDKKLLSCRFWEIYAMQVMTGCICILVYVFYAMTGTNRILTWIFLAYVISASFDINWFFFGMEKFKLTVTRNSIIKILTAVCIFIFIKTQSDVWIYALIMSLGFLGTQFALWPFVHRYISFQKPAWKNIKKHFKGNLTLFIPVIAVSLYKIMDKVMLGKMSTMTEVGYYESTERILQVPLSLITALGTVMMPRMTNLLSKGKETGNYIYKSILFAVFLASSMCFGIMGVSKEFVPLFFGHGFEKCILLFKGLMPSCIFVGFANVLRTQYIIPNGHDKIFIRSVMTGAIVNLVLNAMLIPKYQSVGAALGTLFAEISVCIVQSVAVRKDLPTGKYIRHALPLVLIGLFMFIILEYIQVPETVAGMGFKIILGICLYAIPCGLWLLFAIRRKQNQTYYP